MAAPQSQGLLKATTSGHAAFSSASEYSEEANAAQNARSGLFSDKSRFLTITNSKGQTLHVRDPQQYTQEEIAELRRMHESKANNNIVPKETVMPQDPRTSILNKLDPFLQQPWVQHALANDRKAAEQARNVVCTLISALNVKAALYSHIYREYG